MQTYLVQFDSTNPDNWTRVKANCADAALFFAVRPLVRSGANPRVAYVALDDPTNKHSNGAPIAVIAKELKIVRDGVPVNQD